MAYLVPVLFLAFMLAVTAQSVSSLVLDCRSHHQSLTLLIPLLLYRIYVT